MAAAMGRVQSVIDPVVNFYRQTNEQRAQQVNNAVNQVIPPESAMGVGKFYGAIPKYIGNMAVGNQYEPNLKPWDKMTDEEKKQDLQQNMSLMMMGNLTSVKTVAPNFLSIARKADPGAIDEMAAFTDYLAGVKNKTFKPNFQYEANVRDMAAKLGINPNKSNANLADDFAKILAEGDSLYNKAPQPKGVGEGKWYHGGAKIDEVNLSKSRYDKTFYITDDPNYAKSFGGPKSVVNEMTLDPKAKLIDMRKPTEAQMSEIQQAIQKEMAKPAKYGEGYSFYPYSTEDVIQGLRDGKAHFAELPQIKKILRQLGYDGQITAEVPYAKNVGVWNKNVVKSPPPTQPKGVFNIPNLLSKRASELRK